MKGTRTRRIPALGPTLTAALLLAGLSGAVAGPAAAQPRASERGTMMQVVNGTTITVDYGRPVARGRENLIGGVVHWGEVWTPGANWATTLEVDRPILLEGRRVEPGRYSVWLQPEETGPWRLSLNRTWRLYHDAPVPEQDFVLHVDVRPREGAHMDALAWYVYTVAGRTAELRMHWGPTFVPLTIETEEFTWEPLPADERAALVGSYAFDTNDPTTGGPLRVTISVLEEGGTLVGRWGRAPVALVPAGPAEFRIGFLREGALFDVADEMTLRILTRDGTSVGAELRWEGEVFGEGEKIG
jgi:hypothetical protein